MPMKEYSTLARDTELETYHLMQFSVNTSIWSIDGAPNKYYHCVVDLGVMAMKSCSRFSKAPGLESHHPMQLAYFLPLSNWAERVIEVLLWNKNKKCYWSSNIYTWRSAKKIWSTKMTMSFLKKFLKRINLRKYVQSVLNFWMNMWNCLVWFICLTAYQLFMGYSMLKCDSLVIIFNASLYFFQFHFLSIIICSNTYGIKYSI